jgi:hypothetical protein
MIVTLTGTYISGAPYTVTVNPAASIASTTSFISTPKTNIAGEVYTNTLQCRDTWSNDGIYTTSDSYAITFTRSDGGGSEQLTTTAVHQSAGVYRA